MPDNVAIPSVENEAAESAAAVADELAINFPKINRQLWDVFHDDARNELWVGIKMRTIIKAKTRENGPVEDVEVNIDPLSVVTSLDAAKQSLLIEVAKDQQILMEERQRKQALKSNGILDRLTSGLGKTFNVGKSV
jgi:hypothetical protein